MKTRIIALFAGLLAVLPMTSAWGHDSNHYGIINVAKTGTGSGKVYISDTETKPADPNTKYTWYCNKSADGDTKVIYLWADPDEGCTFEALRA